jgi:hypothetical protein
LAGGYLFQVYLSTMPCCGYHRLLNKKYPRPVYQATFFDLFELGNKKSITHTATCSLSLLHTGSDASRSIV